MRALRVTRVLWVKMVMWVMSVTGITRVMRDLRVMRVTRVMSVRRVMRAFGVTSVIRVIKALRDAWEEVDLDEFSYEIDFAFVLKEQKIESSASSSSSTAHIVTRKGILISVLVGCSESHKERESERTGCGARTGQEGTGASPTRKRPRGRPATVSRGRAWLAARSARLSVRGTLSLAERPRHAQPG
nr:hypothetical protein Itr_chr11CG19680 [Ipomoea trifida]